MATIDPTPDHDDVRSEITALMMVLIDLADYSKDDLIEIVDDAIDGSTE